MKKSKYTVGNFALRVGKSNTGKGLFAEEFIPKGACIIEYFGKEIKKADQKKLKANIFLKPERA